MMDIESSGTVEIVAVRLDGDVIRLLIIDHLSWRDVAAHEAMLDRKIAAYLTSIASGEIYEQHGEKHTGAAAPTVEIVVVNARALPPVADLVFERVRARLLAQGVSFVVELNA
jgi:hypothetical protein